MRGWHRGLVTVNGVWSNQPQFVRSFVNPCLTQSQLSRGRQIAATKQLTVPLRIVFVGRIDTAKGTGRILDIAEQLHDADVAFDIDLIGDGPERARFEDYAKQKGIRTLVHFRGWLARDRIDAYYERAHFILFPSSSSEGWPKVLSEAMAYGAVPVASNISSIPYYVERSDAGKTFPPDDVQAFTQQIIYYLKNPEVWKIASQNSLKVAERFSYENYLKDVRELLSSAR